MITRRALTAFAVAAALPVRAEPASKPIVIGHRGASGERPEHTAMGYRLAIAEGCDFIEPDLVLSKDGHLVARHENEIGGTTDVASRPEFAARKTRKVVDGQGVSGWFTEDFTLAELKSLRARERLPQLRPGSAAFDGREPILTLQEVIDLAASESRRLGRIIGTYPEMKHPSYFSGIGLPMEARLADALKAKGLDSRAAPVFVQCFEVGPLKTFMRLSRARRVFLLQTLGGPFDGKTSYREMAKDMKAITAFANGVGPEWPMVVPIQDGGLGPATSLVAEAHAAGLKVHAWTVRPENQFLPAKLRRGSSPADHGDVGAVYKALFAAGVDGLFSDFPSLAVQARG